MKSFFQFAVITAVCVGASAFAQRGGMRAYPVSAGVAFPGQNDALVANPAGLAEGAPGVLEALYLVDAEQINVGYAAAFGSAGLGLSYRGLNDENIFRFGLGANLNYLKLGVVAVTDNGDGFDGDVGATIDLQRLRLSGVARGISGGVNQIDVGLGFGFSQARFSIDLRKPEPFDQDPWIMDLTLAIMAGSLSAAIGTDALFADGEFSDFSFHAQLEFALGKQFALDLGYRVLPGLLAAGNEYSAGASYRF